MAIKELEIKINKGLSLSSAVKIYKVIDAVDSSIIFYKDGHSVDASSVIDVLALGIEKDSKIKVIVHGHKAQEMIENVSEILIDGAGI